ncbi:metallophosphoesterase family protein [Kineosporia sp. J2-2]|uniref:Metallophosphoesterase family protein n=1 Tax=Kineosporia corallincola TaxID=2835133 RepID=A0ABS5TN56_9ACTN|nr:metallophosphoesterase family protein [Kineosporia corallincola]MBT0771024.1 metallophosphoesterase family protein [Kineosporia corallincola]
MRVAVLADIHGHLPALEAVLRDAERAGVDAYVINGDFLAGPLPGPTLERLVALGDRAVLVHGNCEREVLEAADGRPEQNQEQNPEQPGARAVAEYVAAALDERQRNLIRDLPLSVRLEVDGLGPVRFCHASVRSDVEMVLVDSPMTVFSEAFAGCDEPTVVLGHTHMPFDRLADRRRFVNPGSVGMPYGPGPGAHWALLGPSVQLRRSDYDVQDAARLFETEAPGYPDLAAFIAENVLTVPSDAEALAVFTEMAARL